MVTWGPSWSCGFGSKFAYFKPVVRDLSVSMDTLRRKTWAVVLPQKKHATVSDLAVPTSMAWPVFYMFHVSLPMEDAALLSGAAPELKRERGLFDFDRTIIC